MGEKKSKIGSSLYIHVFYNTACMQLRISMHIRVEIGLDGQDDVGHYSGVKWVLSTN